MLKVKFGDDSYGLIPKSKMQFHTFHCPLQWSQNTANTSKETFIVIFFFFFLKGGVKNFGPKFSSLKQLLMRVLCQICDVMMSITSRKRVNYWIYLLNQILPHQATLFGQLIGINKGVFFSEIFWMIWWTGVSI